MAGQLARQGSRFGVPEKLQKQCAHLSASLAWHPLAGPTVALKFNILSLGYFFVLSHATGMPGKSRLAPPTVLGACQLV